MLRSRYGISRPSVRPSVCLSSVTFVRGAPVQTVELFVNVLHHLIAQERGQIAPERGQFLFVGSLYYFLEKNERVLGGRAS